MAAKFMPAEQVNQAYKTGLGFCRSCGAESRDVEPDAEHLQCTCGALDVHGPDIFIANAWVS